MAKRLMCIVLSVLMIMTVLPTGVIADANVDATSLADETDGEQSQTVGVTTIKGEIDSGIAVAAEEEGISLTADETDYVAKNVDTGTSYESLSDAITGASTGETIQLSADVTGAITIASDDDIILDLAGHTLTVSDAGKVITVNGKLTLEDSSESGTGKITNGSTTGAVYVYYNATFIMNGGTITESNYGVYLCGGSSFTMNGGSISENTGTYVIYVNGNSSYDGITFTMNGGTISSNKGYVFVKGSGNSNRSTFIMNGGSITSNSVGGSSKYCGVLLNNATFIMNGGSITNNKSTGTAGGGVYMKANSTFYMNGGSISNNTATYGAGICMYAASAEVYMTGGTITGNTATSSSYGGGGVYLYNGASLTMTGGAIYGNTATASGADIFMAGSSSTATLLAASDMIAQGQSFTGYSWYTDASGSRFDATSNVTSTVDVTNTLTGSSYALIAAKTSTDVIPTLYGRSLSLGTQIGINYYFDFSETSNTSATGYYVKFVIDGEEDSESTTLTAKVSGGNTYYVATCRVYFYQMAENVSINLYNGSDELVGTYGGGSIRSYYNSISAKSTTSTYLNDLLLALLNYGGYGQTYVNQNTDSLANNGLSTTAVTSVTADDVSSYVYNITLDSDDYTVNASIAISTTESCEIKFTISTSKTGYTVTVNGTDAGTGVTSASSGTILVQNWDSPVNLTIYEDDEAVYTLKFSVLSYVYSVLSDSSSDENLQNLVKAMYNYNRAAEAYLDNL
ncbi:MAG: hypothetical protein LUE20_10100 [Oscillospiraceae bacterium]|nr:hypothetical protein [Oscillospiraceae bacterium]